jgi:predicted ATP-dependent protease
MIEEKIDEMIQEGTIRVAVSGREVGQVNGLSILALGDYSFGKPSRISAATYIGKGSIVNIEREVELSGKIHSKGVLILSGYLGATYAQRRPLALSASLAFEQLYDEVDGDSASSAELYCLLSSLSGVALRQDLAVTGSVDQRGRVQAVGGVNEKIEGFFSVCKKLGFTGSQGVLIPLDNARHLMLRGEVLEAVRNGIFHVYAAETIDQGLALLTGMEAGERMPDGTFPDGTFHHEVESKLDAFAQVLAQYRAQQEQPVHAVPV